MKIFLTSYGFTNFAISGHTEGNPFALVLFSSSSIFSIFFSCFSYCTIMQISIVNKDKMSDIFVGGNGVLKLYESL